MEEVLSNLKQKNGKKDLTKKAHGLSRTAIGLSIGLLPTAAFAIAGGTPEQLAASAVLGTSSLIAAKSIISTANKACDEGRSGTKYEYNLYGKAFALYMLATGASIAAIGANDIKDICYTATSYAVSFIPALLEIYYDNSGANRTISESNNEPKQANDVGEILRELGERYKPSSAFLK